MNGESQKEISEALHSNQSQKNDVIICSKVGFISAKYGVDFYTSKGLAGKK